MKQIPTNKPGIFGLVDDEDYERATSLSSSWHLFKGYIRCCVYVKEKGKGVCHSLHRIVMKCELGDGRIVDHINRVKTDNRKENLRFVSAEENARNNGDIAKRVYCDKSRKSLRKWRGIKIVLGVKKSTKYFVTKEEALKAIEEVVYS